MADAPKGQPLCAGCLEPIETPDVIQQFSLENRYKRDYANTHLGTIHEHGLEPRVLLCKNCLAKLEAIKAKDHAHGK
jgi:hypothetical protein